MLAGLLTVARRAGWPRRFQRLDAEQVLARAIEADEMKSSAYCPPASRAAFQPPSIARRAILTCHDRHDMPLHVGTYRPPAPRPKRLCTSLGLRGDIIWPMPHGRRAYIPGHHQTPRLLRRTATAMISAARLLF